MSTADQPAVLTLQECADEMRVSLALMKRHAQAGTLVCLTLGINTDPGSCAPKVYRVTRAEWERFKAWLPTAKAEPTNAPAEDDAPRVRRGRPKKGEGGTDYWSQGGYRERGAK